MGTVYLAEDTTLKRHVALKFLSPERVGSSDAAAPLLREARAISSLDHPHIATIYEIGTHAGQPFIAMAYYEGETLAARFTRGPMAIDEVARILAQVADAIHAAHRAGIVHRDLKPSNVMLTTTGQAKVLDFGIAKTDTAETATQLTAVGETVGTAAYMSPEQAAGEPVDAGSDLWSLGVVAYEMLTGRPLFQGTNALAIIQAVMTATPVPLTTLRPDSAPELQEIVKQTLVRDRERRATWFAPLESAAAGPRDGGGCRSGSVLVGDAPPRGAFPLSAGPDWHGPDCLAAEEFVQSIDADPGTPSRSPAAGLLDRSSRGDEPRNATSWEAPGTNRFTCSPIRMRSCHSREPGHMDSAASRWIARKTYQLP